jgi:hypothetical protein
LSGNDHHEAQISLNQFVQCALIALGDTLRQVAFLLFAEQFLATYLV